MPQNYDFVALDAIYDNVAALQAVDCTNIVNGSRAGVFGMGNYALNKNSSAVADNMRYIQASASAAIQQGWMWEASNQYLQIDANAHIDQAQIFYGGGAIVGVADLPIIAGNLFYLMSGAATIQGILKGHHKVGAIISLYIGYAVTLKNEFAVDAAADAMHLAGSADYAPPLKTMISFMLTDVVAGVYMWREIARAAG